MSEIENQNAAAQQEAPARESFDSNSMFNDPIEIADYDDSIPISDNFWSASDEAIENEKDLNQPPANTPAPENQGANPDGDLVFKDELLQQQEAAEENKSDDELKALLEKRGYKVDKPQEQDVNAQRNQESVRLTTVISDAEKFLTLAPEVIAREKVRADLSREYQRTGRQNLINGEEFQLDLDSELEQYTQNPALLNIFANNVKTEVQNVIDKSKNDKEKIDNEINTETKKILIEKRTGYQNSLKAIHKSGIFGVKPTAEEANEIYNSIISGEFTKAVNSDPNLVTEFATFRKFREQINSKLGGPTYGEGARAAAEAINGGPLKTETPLSKIVQNTNQGVSSGGTNNRRESWKAETVKVENPDDVNKNKIIAGAGASFL